MAQQTLGHGHFAAEKPLLRAESLGQGSGEPRQLTLLHLRLNIFYSARGNYPGSVEHGQKALLSGQRFVEPFLSFCAHLSLSYAHTVNRRFDLAVPDGMQALADYLPEYDAHSRLSTARHSARCWAFSSVSDTACGRLDQALARALHGAWESERGSSEDQMFGADWLGFLFFFRGNFVQSRDAFQRSVEAARKIGSNMYVVVGLRVMAAIDMCLQGPDQGLAPLLTAGGDSARAQHLLGRAYEEITEGRDTYPLQQAAAALTLLNAGE